MLSAEDRNLNMAKRVTPVMHPMRLAIPRKTYKVCRHLVGRLGRDPELMVYLNLLEPLYAERE